MPPKNLKTIPQQICGTPGSSVPAPAASDGLRARGKGDSREAAKSGQSQGCKDPVGEHCCLNIKQGCLISHVGDFPMIPRAPR